jgi:hypothetical protein
MDPACVMASPSSGIQAEKNIPECSNTVTDMDTVTYIYYYLATFPI